MFDICVHKEIEKKGTKMGHHTAKKKGVKNCTPNKIIQKERERKKDVH